MNLRTRGDTKYLGQTNEYQRAADRTLLHFHRTFVSFLKDIIFCFFPEEVFQLNGLDRKNCR